MRRGGAAALLLALCAAGALSAAALVGVSSAGADEGTTATTGTGTTATDTTPTTTAPTTTAPQPPPPRRDVIAPGVTVGTVLVGGLSSTEAKELLRRRFARPLVLVVSPTRRMRVTPQELGAAAHLGDAVKRARIVRTGAIVPLAVDVNRARVERFLRGLGRALNRPPVESRVLLQNFQPRVTKDVPGRRLKEVIAARTVVLALKTHVRDPLQLPFEDVQPQTTPDTIGRMIVIRRETKRLELWNGVKLERRFRVATGQSSYPTPLGRFEIVNKWRNPWWYPPQGSAWAEGKEPVPPGPGNPLGTRWMGISSPYVGIHGTPDAASIGYSASHGCVRMLIPQVEWLFERVEVGTPVFIVRA